MAQQERTWSEIKMRNPSQQVQNELNAIMEHYNEATASKALERIIVSHMDDIQREETLRENVASLNREIANLKSSLKQRENEIANIKSAYTNFISLVSE